MSTRSQVFIKDTGIYLYQHWDGSDLFDRVQTAIKSNAGQACLHDEEYLARVIFEHLLSFSVDMGVHGKSLGFGIGTQIHSDIERLVVVDCRKRTVLEKTGYDKTWRKSRIWKWLEPTEDSSISLPTIIPLNPKLFSDGFVTHPSGRRN
jgi:hypothetical protein